jgi:hypothetical protein
MPNVSLAADDDERLDVVRRFLPVASAAWLMMVVVACTPPREPQATSAPVPPTSTSADAAAVTRRPIETPSPATPAPPATLATPSPPVVVPPGVIYVCVTGSGSSTVQTAIEYIPKVDALCRKHPEMGPCQYERNACRSKGGRVFAADGKEITMVTEAEYDKKVRRVTFKAN